MSPKHAYESVRKGTSERLPPFCTLCSRYLSWIFSDEEVGNVLMDKNNLEKFPLPGDLERDRRKAIMMIVSWIISLMK